MLLNSAIPEADTMQPEGFVVWKLIRKPTAAVQMTRTKQEDGQKQRERKIVREGGATRRCKTQAPVYIKLTRVLSSAAHNSGFTLTQSHPGDAILEKKNREQ